MEERGMSQIEFSKATGIAQSTISEWKRKKTNPAADKIMVICEVLTLLLVVFAALTYIDKSSPQIKWLSPTAIGNSR